jgi:hypothetical protein
MKQPIEPSEIRKGDLIRWESDVVDENAEEWRSRHDQPPYRAWGQHYLLDRPTAPAVELPTEPSLGWLTYAGSTIFGTFRRFKAGDAHLDSMKWEATEVRGDDPHNSYSSVTAFTPATAVPTEALNELREAHDGGAGCCIGCRAYVSVGHFLAAVDEANS